MTVEERQSTATRRPEPDSGAPVIASGQTFGIVTQQISAVPLLRRKIPPLWYGALAVGLMLTFVLLYAATYLLFRGVGILGIEVPVAWAYFITDFVWWIGIGHAGTLISAFLLLLNQRLA